MDSKTTNLIQKQQQGLQEGKSKKKTMQDLIQSMQGEIKKALPSVLTPERFTRMVLSAISTTPKLTECDAKSVLGAMMTAAQLGVEPNTALGQAYLIPYYNSRKKQYECQFQLGYKGLLDLAWRSGEVSTVDAHIVYENDEFEYSYGLNPTLKHVPAIKDRGNAIAYYAVFKTVSGGFAFEVMSIDDVKAHARRYSKSFESGPWQTNFDEMARKTVLKRVLKYAPLKTEFVRQVAQDETVKTKIDEDMYSVDNEIVWEAEGEEVQVDDSTGEVIDITEAGENG